MPRRVLALAAVVLLVGAAAAPARQFDSKKIPNDLRQIALAYHSYVDANGKGPAKAEDLAPYLENDKRMVGLLKDKDVVLFYGYKITEIANAEGTSNTVMGYEKDAPTKGGCVVMFDGSVKKMSADDFKKAKMPPEK
jgi:hypothetical protein